jgi:hypothetical protein
MIDLPDYGYVMRNVQLADPGGALPGTLGGPSDYIARPGGRYTVTIQTREMPTSEASVFEELLEQANQQDASYPWPLDFRPPVASAPGSYPHVNGAQPAGGGLVLTGFIPGYQIRRGQPFEVFNVVQGTGYIHKAASTQTADGTGTFNPLLLFPWTRTSFADDDRVHIERPRIRGILQFQGSSQPAYGRRAFQFSITERR